MDRVVFDEKTRDVRIVIFSKFINEESSYHVTTRVYYKGFLTNEQTHCYSIKKYKELFE